MEKTTDTSVCGNDCSSSDIIADSAMIRGLVVAMCLIYAVTGTASQEAWLQQSLDILQNPSSVILDDSFTRDPSEEHRRLAAEILQQGQQQQAAVSKPITIEQEDTHASAIIFISFSIPEPELKAILGRKQDVDTTFILRGLIKGTNITGTMKRILRLTRDMETQPRVTLDPERFTQYNIHAVPTMIYQHHDGGKQLIARGITSTQWAKAHADADKTGDLGTYGTTYPIAETDLIEELKTVAASLDQDKLIEDAISKYWDKYRFIILPPADKNRTRVFDPSITVTEDITAPDGTVIARQGQVINPLDTLPFTKKLIVFNPTDPAEYQFAQQQTTDAIASNIGVILIATKIDAKRGWEHLNSLAQEFNYPVYLLNRQLQRRFDLQHTPTLIQQRHNKLEIQELKLPIS